MMTDVPILNIATGWECVQEPGEGEGKEKKGKG